MEQALNILVVEDEILVAIEIEHVIEEMGHRAAGIAPDMASALANAAGVHIALVDLNLRDGPTGMEIGRRLAADHGTTIIFMTANPAQLGEDECHGLGVISKPVSDRELRQTIAYAAAMRGRGGDCAAPARLKLFQTHKITAAAG